MKRQRFEQNDAASSSDEDDGILREEEEEDADDGDEQQQQGATSKLFRFGGASSSSDDDENEDDNKMDDDSDSDDGDDDAENGGFRLASNFLRSGAGGAAGRSSFFDDDDDDSDEEEQWVEPASIQEKRKLYKCGAHRAVQLQQIPTWPQYAQQHADRIEACPSAAERLAQPRDDLNQKISLFKGDSTTLEIDAIVNAANESLLGGGGIDGAIHSAAGPFLRQECATLDGCETGDAKITKGYRLPAKHVIHTVGPVGENARLLRSCYQRCLELVDENQIRTVAFCCISTGIYGYPLQKATHVALQTVRQWLETHADKVDRIIFVVFLEKELQCYEDLIPKYFPASSASDDDGAAASSSAADADGDKHDDENGDSDSDNDDEDENKDEEDDRSEQQSQQKGNGNAADKPQDEDVDMDGFAGEEEEGGEDIADDDNPDNELLKLMMGPTTDNDDEDEESSDDEDEDGDTGMQDDETEAEQEAQKMDRKEGNVWYMSERRIPVSQVNLDSRVISALQSFSVQELFAVQRAVVPVAIAMAKSSTPGDICVGSPTGSGKTLSYVLPIQELLLKYRNRALRAVVVVPTTNLASQVLAVFKQFEPHTGIKAATVTGTVLHDLEAKQLVKTQPRIEFLVDVVIGTPGSVLAHLGSTPGFNFDQLEFLVLDEVDSLLMTENVETVKQIVQSYYSSEAYLAKQKRSRAADVPFPVPSSFVRKILCSATLGANPAKLEQLKLFRPQFFTYQSRANKKYVLPSLLEQHTVVYKATFKPLYLVYLVRDVFEQDAKVLCFTNSNQSSQRLYDYLKGTGFQKIAVFTRLMTKQEQQAALKAFDSGEATVLITSDAIARGIDFHRVDHVVNYELPRSLKVYVHRVGRTARAGRSGNAYNFCLPDESAKFSTMISRTESSPLKELNIRDRDFDIYKSEYMDYLRKLMLSNKLVEKNKLKMQTAEQKQANAMNFAVTRDHSRLPGIQNKASKPAQNKRR